MPASSVMPHCLARAPAIARRVSTGVPSSELSRLRRDKNALVKPLRVFVGEVVDDLAGFGCHITCKCVEEVEAVVVLIEPASQANVTVDGNSGTCEGLTTSLLALADREHSDFGADCHQRVPELGEPLDNLVHVVDVDIRPRFQKGAPTMC